MTKCCDDIHKTSYDVTVIGAGSAGFSAAITAAENGATVALIGDGTIGGTCVNVGCVPSKALIRATDVLHTTQASSRFQGIKASSQVTDWSKTVQQKQRLVEDLRKSKYLDILQDQPSIKYLTGKATFTDEGQLSVAGNPINTKKIIIATGSRPSIPAIEGIHDIPYLTSTTALELETLPSSLLVIGAGYIGTEIAQMFARAGVKVTIVCRRGLLPEAEPEIGEALTAVFQNENITVISGITYEKIEAKNKSITLSVQKNNSRKQINAEKVLIATGRSPNTETLNLPSAGIELTHNNAISVDQKMQTSAPNIYAAGDVIGKDQFVYMAAYGAKIAAKNALCDNALSYDSLAMPAVVFTDPQIASVGLTEAQAKANNLQIRTSVLSLDNVPRALAARDTRGLIKLIADKNTKQLLGAHIMAPEGADSIQTAVLAIKARMTYEQLGETIFPYLTTVEGLKLAAQTFDMDISKLSCCAG